MNAVITADIVDYTKLTDTEANKILNAIHIVFKKLEVSRTNLISNFLIKRGDSIQMEINNPSETLKVALVLKSAINKIDFSNNKRKAPTNDVRIAIGIGSIDSKRETINESSGDAYINSGRTLDTMKKNKRLLVIKTNDAQIDAELETEFKLLEVIMSGWKTTSAEVIYWTLLGLSERMIAEQLGVTQSAINQRKGTAGWNGIEALLNRFETVLK
jgi:hypothetical protein